MKGDVISNWQYFCNSWQNYEIATGLNDKANDVRVATLLTIMGKECYQVYENLPLTIDERKDSKAILEKLGQHFEPQRNTIYERYIFNSASQEDQETFEQFLNRLRKLAATCDYGTLLDELLRDRIVVGIRDNATRARLLRETKLTFAKSVDICRTSEAAAMQLQKMETKKEESVHAMKARTGKKQPSSCYYCGDFHPPGKCPAYGQECPKCHKKNHLAKVCRSSGGSRASKDGDKGARPKIWHKKKTKKVHQVDTQEDVSSSEESIYGIGTAPGTQYFVELQVRTQTDKKSRGKSLKFQIDTGATCSTLRLQDYKSVTTEPLQPSSTRLRLYDKTILHPEGATTLQCMTNNGCKKKIHFEVVDNAATSLLSGKASEALHLLQFSQEQLIHEVKTTMALTKDDILRDYKDVFTGLGKLPGVYHIQMDKAVKPVQNTRRRVPVLLREELKAKLQDLERQQIIAKVEDPTAWISNMVVVKKPNKLRVCLDPQNLNKGIQRNHHPIPTIEEIAPRLVNAKVFSVADAKDGFLQVVLDEESSYLTTFWTPHGRFRWLRMPFGISSAPEEFQRRLDEVLEGLNNIEVIADDIIIFGTGNTEQEAEESHDRAFLALLQRCRERGLKLNKRKLKYKMPSVAYMGHIISARGLSPDPDKVKAIQQMPRPTDVQGVQRLLGVVTYLAKFMPRLSDVCEPLRRLTDKEVEFDWLHQHDTALDTIKQLITEAPVLQYYDVKKEVTIECDSSNYGLGAVLMQEGRPVAYASRTLTPTERNYAQLEKECLAILFAAERFDQYILGRDNIRVQSDHKPLMSIFTKPILTSPKRLQRMRLRLQKYSLNVEYKPGPDMHISDTLSRAALPLPEVTSNSPPYVIFQVMEECKLLEELADSNMETDVFVTDDRLQKIREETNRDMTMQTLANTIIAGWPNDKTHVPLCIRNYWPFKDELATQNGIIYRGSRVVIPTRMRSELRKRAHASHLGAQSTINKAREIMFWPGMNSELTDMVQKCSTCQETQPGQSREPLMSYPLPTSPWQVVATDCFVLDGQTYSVFVDTYSDFIEVAELVDMTADTMVKTAKLIFKTHGIPAVLISDNGPNYASREFQQFTREWDFTHTTTSPHFSQSNGKAESAVKITKGLMKKAKRDGGDKWLAILEWLNTPTPGMSSSPAQRLMSRRTRTLLPCKSNLYTPKVQDAVPQQVAHKRQQAKRFFDRRAKSLPDLVIGQPIRAKAHPRAEDSPWKPGIVKGKVAPRSYLVEVEGRQYRRNRKHLRDTYESPGHVPPINPIDDLDVDTTSPAPTAKPQDIGSSLDAKSPQTQTTREVPVVTRSGRVTKRPQYLKDYAK